jgi:RNA polymerase sigma-70 factor (ECF subfamily)
MLMGAAAYSGRPLAGGSFRADPRMAGATISLFKPEDVRLAPVARLITGSIAIETIPEIEPDRAAPIRPDAPRSARTPVSKTQSKTRLLSRESGDARDPCEAGDASGVNASFDSLVARHEPRVRRLAHRLLGWDAAAVDDIVQDVFLAALRHLDRLRGDASIETWLSAITLNRCRTHRRRQLLRCGWRGKSRGREGDAGAAMKCAGAAMEPAAPAGGSPVDRASRVETSAAVRAAVHALGARDREVIVLFYLEELSVADIAKILDTSRGAVDVRLHRARRRLKENLTGLAPGL